MFYQLRLDPYLLLLFWPLSIGLRLLYWRKWMWIAEKHLCGTVKTWTALHTSRTTTHGLTHCDRSVLLRSRVAQVQSATAPSQVIHFNKIRTPGVSSIYLQFHAKRFRTLPVQTLPCLNPSYLRLRFLRVIRCGVCSVFCFFVDSLTSTLA